MPCCASPPNTFCQEKVATSSLVQSMSCANIAEVASQMVRPLRSPAIQSPPGRELPMWCRSRQKPRRDRNRPRRGQAVRHRARSSPVHRQA
jgi:hypothetical protein